MLTLTYSRPSHGTVWPVPWLQVGVNIHAVKPRELSTHCICVPSPAHLNALGNCSHSGSPQGVKRWLYRTLLGIVCNLLGAGWCEYVRLNRVRVEPFGSVVPHLLLWMPGAAGISLKVPKSR